MSDENPYAAPKTVVENFSVQEGISSPGVHNYASRGQRLLGSLIDGLILFAVWFAIESIFNMNASFDWSFGISNPVILSLLEGVMSIMVTVAIQGYFWATRCQSLGKMVMRTQIVDLKGEPVAWYRIVILRFAVMELLFHLPEIGGLILMFDLLGIFRRQHNCFHDDIAGTRVIKLPPQ